MRGPPRALSLPADLFGITDTADCAADPDAGSCGLAAAMFIPGAGAAKAAAKAAGKAAQKLASRLNRALPSRPVTVAAEARALNAAGRPYPRVLDPRTGKPISFPGGGLSKVPVGERVPWGAQERGTYIKEWYDRGYTTPEGGWARYDIHHITPREYGGTNDFNNLVPVLRDVHQSELNAWWRDYR